MGTNPVEHQADDDPLQESLRKPWPQKEFSAWSSSLLSQHLQHPFHKEEAATTTMIFLFLVSLSPRSPFSATTTTTTTSVRALIYKLTAQSALWNTPFAALVQISRITPSLREEEQISGQHELPAANFGRARLVVSMPSRTLAAGFPSSHQPWVNLLPKSILDETYMCYIFRQI